MSIFTVNQSHPAWVQFWESHQVFETVDEAVEAGHPVWLMDTLADIQCERIHLFYNEITSDLRYMILESDDGDIFIVPHEMGFEEYPTLEEAAQFAFSENYLDDHDDWSWNEDEDAVLVDGEVLLEDI